MGGGSYQTLINDALREHIRRGGIEAAVRRAVRKAKERVSIGAPTDEDSYSVVSIEDSLATLDRCFELPKPALSRFHLAHRAMPYEQGFDECGEFG